MTQGMQIPIQTVVEQHRRRCSFKDAALTLKVTPQITAANTVIMKISLENASADFARAVNGIPPINTQRANTTGARQRRPDDGHRRHLHEQPADSTATGRPGSSQIPLLNWLFKRDTHRRRRARELLIFITPRIIKG